MVRKIAPDAPEKNTPIDNWTATEPMGLRVAISPSGVLRHRPGTESGKAEGTEQIGVTNLHYRRNVIALVLFEFTWGLGMPFTLYSTMVPAYLTVLGATKLLIGVMQAIWMICTPIQIMSAHYHSGRNRTRNAMFIYITAVGVRLIHDVVVNLRPASIATGTMRGIFATATIIFVALIVYAQPLFFGLMTENIPRERRGRLYGLRTLGLGVGGLIMGVLAAKILATFDAPGNYQVSFLIGDSLLLVSCFSLLLFRDMAARDKPDSEVPLLISLKQKFKTLLDEPNYRIFLLFHVLNLAAVNLAAFVVPYAKERLHFLDSQVGILSMIFLATGAVFGSLIGRLADRYGYRAVAMIQSLLLIVFFLITLNLHSLYSIYVAYALYSIVSMSLVMVLVNMSVELCPSMTAVDLTALGTTLILPIVATVSPMMGSVIDRGVDYQTVFMIGLAVAAVALLGFACIVQEPRRGRLYVIKQILVR